MDKYLKPPVWVIQWSRLLMSVLASIVFILFLPWVQFSSGVGQVIGLDPSDRIQVIHAPVSGVIRKWHVQEGSLVKKGDPLVSLSDTDVDLLQRLQLELDAAKSTLKASELALRTSQINLKRQQELFQQGLASRKAWEEQKIHVAKMEIEVAKAQALLVKTQKDFARQDTQSIIAPTDGTVLRVHHGEGAQFVKQGDQLIVFVPQNPKLAAEIWIDANDASLINVGDRALLEFAGWPAVQIPGWPSLAIGTFQARVVLVDTAASMKGMFRVVLQPDTPWPSAKFLRQGTRASGFVSLKRVSLGWELWRKFNGMPLESMELHDEMRSLLNTKKDSQ